MNRYLQLLDEVLHRGVKQDNRTGIPAIRLPYGSRMLFDMRDGFPAVTTKHLFFNQVKGELIGFIRGYSNAADFRALGCKVWDQNANENEAWVNNPRRKGTDDLGRVYGVQWREWMSTEYGGPLYVDQLKEAVHAVINNPTSRRIIVNAWNPGELDMMALPPCHMLFQLTVDVQNDELSMCMYQRSCDMFLGVPFNIASYALLLHIIAEATGYTPRFLTMFLADAHIYENHIEQVREQLTREPLPMPTLALPIADPLHNWGMQYIESVGPESISLLDYKHHPAIKGAMAV